MSHYHEYNHILMVYSNSELKKKRNKRNKKEKKRKEGKERERKKNSLSICNTNQKSKTKKGNQFNKN